MFPLFINAQQISLGLDAKNAFVGGTVNSKAIDFNIRVLFKGTGIFNEVGVVYERFDKLNFECYSLQLNRTFEHKKLTFVIGTEHNLIHRWSGYLEKQKNSGINYFSYGANVEIRYNLNKECKLSVQNNYRFRADIEKYVNSVIINLIYKINEK